MVQEKRILDKELRQELSKQSCYAIMDYLMVHFNDESKDFHYNYYFDTKDHALSKRNITLRLRSIIKDKAMSYKLTLKIPTIDEDTYLEYNQKLDEKAFRLLAYNHKLPEGEIAELTSIHGGDVTLANMIKVNRVFALYNTQKIFFDRISHKGKTYYEVGTRIDQSKPNKDESKMKRFIELLKRFNITYEQAQRRSVKYND